MGVKSIRFAKNENGQTLVISAAFMGLIAIGFVAMAVDTGYLFREKRRAQSAADAAALAAATEIASNYPANQQTAANAAAKQNGFDTTLASGPASVVLSTLTTGSFAGYVQATVSRPVPTVFLKAFTRKPTTTVSASAVAGAGAGSPTCVCLLGTSGRTLDMSNNSKLNASGCGIVDNSSSSNAIGVVGSANISGLSLGTVSTTWNNSSNINNNGSISSSTKIITGIPNSCNPTMPAAPAYGACVADPGGSYGTFSFGPASAGGVICYNGLTIGASGSTVTLKPGTYVIPTGQLHFLSGSNNKSNLGGNGVFFYLTGSASLVIDNGANVNLVAGGAKQSNGVTAPTVGNYNGLLFYQNTSDTNSVTLQGGSSTYMTGSLYLPGAGLSVGNGSSGTVTAGVVAKTMTMNGGGTFTAATTTDQGSLSSGSAKVVQ